VMVEGAVYHPTAYCVSSRQERWMVSAPGRWPDNMAHRKATFAIRADGSVDGGSAAGSAEASRARRCNRETCWSFRKRLIAALHGGRVTLQAAQLVSAAGIALQIARSF